MRRSTLIAGGLGFALVLGLLVWLSGRSDSGSAAPKAAGTVELVVWDRFTGPELRAYKKLNQEFQAANPNIRLREVRYGWDVYWQKLRAAEAIKRGPDVGPMYAAGFMEPYKQGLLPLDSRLTQEQRDNLLFLREARSPTDNKTYILPRGINGAWWFYNKAQFKKAGLDPESPPTTLAELLDACDSLKHAGFAPFVDGMLSDYNGYGVMSMIGGQLLTGEEIQKFWQEQVPWTSPQIHQSLEYFAEVGKHCLGPNGASTGASAEDLFSGGKGTMFANFALNNVAKYKRNLGAENIGVALFPTVPGGMYPQYMDAQPYDGWAITSWSRHPDEAFKYISFMNGPKAQQEFWDQARIPPNDRRVTASSSDPLIKRALEMSTIKENHLGTVPSNQGEIDAANSFYAQLATGRMSVDEFIKRVEPARERALRDLGQ